MKRSNICNLGGGAAGGGTGGTSNFDNLFICGAAGGGAGSPCYILIWWDE